MSSALAAQLERLGAGREERLRGKPSLLYDPQQAADVDLQTIYGLALSGAPSACARQPRGGWVSGG